MFEEVPSQRLQNSWNNLFYNLHQEVTGLLEDLGICLFFADPFFVNPSFYFDNKEDIKKFNELVNTKFNLNLPLDSDYTFWQIEVEIVTKDMIKNLSAKSLPDTIDLELFNPLFNNPKKELINYILSVISEGNFTYLGEAVETQHAYTSTMEMQSNKYINGYKTILEIQSSKLHEEYTIVNVYPIKSL